MDIVIGTYDSLIGGFQLIRKTDGTKNLEIVQRFSDVSHKGCIKCLEVSDQGILASGSTDEMVQLFDLKRGIEVGTLVSHEGDVTCLKFLGKDFLYSSSADGTIRMWRPRIWEIQRTLNAHKAAVLGFDIHPSNKLALSVSSDKKLVLWDLVACKYSFVRNMKKSYDSVHFNESGSHFAMRSGTSVDVFELGAVDPNFSLNLNSHVNHITKLSDDLFAAGTDDGKIQLMSISEKKVVLEIKAHESRIRGVVAVHSSKPDRRVLVTCSSDKLIKAWSLDLTNKKFEVLAEINTGCRITCLAVFGSKTVADEFLGSTVEPSETKPLDTTSAITTAETKSEPLLVKREKRTNKLPALQASKTVKKGILKKGKTADSKVVSKASLVQNKKQPKNKK